VAAAQAMGGVVIVKGLRDVDDAIVIYGDRFSECLGPRFEDKKEEFTAWAKTPVPIEIERERANYIERPNELAEIGPRVAMVDYAHLRLCGVRVPGVLQPLPAHI